MLFINDVEINVTIFPDKTSQVWKIPDDFLNKKSVIVRWEFDNEGEFLHLTQLKHLLDSYGVSSELFLDYLPYARQDKNISNNTTFALHSFCKLLNTLNFNSITCMDPHSQFAQYAVSNFKTCYPISSLQYLINTIVSSSETELIACYPDAGAARKYPHIYNIPYVYGLKTREPSTGIITDYKVVGTVYGKSVIIIDDICDGGKTFELLTKILYEKGAKEVNLFVTHGLFTQGLDKLKEVGIKRIFSKNGEHK